MRHRGRSGDDVQLEAPQQGLIGPVATDLKPLRSGSDETPAASPGKQSPAPRTNVVKISLDDLPKGVTPYPADKALPDLAKLGLLRRDHCDGKPRHGATGEAHAMNTEGRSSAAEARRVQPDPVLPKGVERYPANKALPHLPRGVAIDSPAQNPARQSSTPEDALAKVDLKATN